MMKYKICITLLIRHENQIEEFLFNTISFVYAGFEFYQTSQPGVDKTT